MGKPPGGIPAQPVERRHRLAEIILDESRRAGLRRGSRLPTERQLAANLGATRTSVRRALTVLEAEGRISREVGRGTFLREEPDGSAGDGAAAGRAGGADRVAEQYLGQGGRPAGQGQVVQGGEDHRGVPPARRRRLDGAQRLGGLTHGDGDALVERRCSAAMTSPKCLSECAGHTHR